LAQNLGGSFAAFVRPPRPPTVDAARLLEYFTRQPRYENTLLAVSIRHRRISSAN
jgi:hypothetical protein